LPTDPLPTQQILNPQSAILPNAEVLHFLSTRPLREPDRKVGSYIPTSQSGLSTIRHDLLTYFRETTPWTQTFAAKYRAEDYLNPSSETEVYDDTNGWIRRLVEQLGKYELTKAEVLMIVNLGLGLEDWKERMPPRLRDGADGVRSAEEQRVSDEWVLGTVCEELEQRFGPEEIQGILKTVGDVMREEGKVREEGSEVVGGTEADQIEGVVSAGKGEQGYDGTDETDGHVE
jgi:hypothetical protein